jgi:hypothetical protein
MPRTISSSLLVALSQPEVQPFYAIEIDLDSGPLRLWTGIGPRTIDDEVYTGGGSLMAISGLEEVADLSAKNITLSLSGMPEDIIGLALQEPYQRRKVRVLWGVTNVSDFVEVFSGSLNQMVIEDSPESGTISVTVDSKLVELERASNRRYTAENHKSRYPNDSFFDYVTELQDKNVRFGDF